MKNLRRFFVILSIAVLLWVIVQYLTYIVEMPDFLDIIFSVLINFNMVLYISLPVLLIGSIILLFKNEKWGILTFLVNIISCLLFYNPQPVISFLKGLS